jgi:hypothetical protein
MRPSITASVTWQGAYSVNAVRAAVREVKAQAGYFPECLARAMKSKKKKKKKKHKSAYQGQLKLKKKKKKKNTTSVVALVFIDLISNNMSIQQPNMIIILNLKL